MKSYPLVMFYFILFDQFHHRVGINDGVSDGGEH